MTAELKNKLFLISERTGRPGTEGENEYGAWVVVSKGIIEKHGGKIWVRAKQVTGVLLVLQYLK